MSRTMPVLQPKIPRGLIIVLWVVVALLLILFALVDFARGFHESFSGLLSGW